MNFKDLRTREKLTLAFGVLLALSLLIAIIGGLNMRKIKNRADWAIAIESSQKDFLMARVNMNSYIRLKNDSLAEVALKYIDKSVSAANEVLGWVNDGQDKNLLNDYLKGLKEYKDLIIQNQQAVKGQNESVEQRKKLKDQVYAEAKKAGIAETHPMFSYFSLVRLNTANIQIFNDPAYYNQVLSDLKNMNAMVNTGKGVAINQVVVQYSKAIDLFYTSFIASEELVKKQVEAGQKITLLSDKIVGQSTDYIASTSQSATIFLVLITLLSLGVGIVTAYMITRYFTVMLGKASNLAETYAKGDLTYKFTQANLDLKDEIGDLARAMKHMGDRLKDIIRGINNGAQSLLDASQQVSGATQEISKGANEQAASVEEISSSMEEMSATIMQNTDNARKTGDLASSVSSDVGHMAETGQRSLQSVKQIIAKINIINEIAFQTNILALNAAVEAARAGEHGKGFAVVAAEVRKLAERSRDAANEIVSLSKESLQVTEEAENLMAALVPKITTTSSLVAEIASSSEEQNSGASQVNNAVQQLNQITQENASSSEELATSAEELANQAEQLREMIAYFKIDEKMTTFTALAAPKKVEFIPAAPAKPVVKQKPVVKAESKGVKLNLKSDVADEMYEHF